MTLRDHMNAWWDSHVTPTDKAPTTELVAEGVASIALQLPHRGRFVVVDVETQRVGYFAPSMELDAVLQADPNAAPLLTCEFRYGAEKQILQMQERAQNPRSRVIVDAIAEVRRMVINHAATCPQCIAFNEELRRLEAIENSLHNAAEINSAHTNEREAA